MCNKLHIEGICHKKNCDVLSCEKCVIAILNKWIGSIKDWVKEEVKDLDDIENSVDGLETEGSVVLHTVYDVFNSVIF